MEEGSYQATPKRRFSRIPGSAWKFTLAFFEWILDGVEENFGIMLREKDLFFGMTLFLLGFLNFHSGKYCDGNTADYLSCTRPTTYYYYGWLEVLVILVGIYFITLWFLKRQRA